jgi:hypothetical protein
LKKLSIFLILILFFAGARSFAQAPVTICKPYSFPIQSTIASCGAGFIGSKYKVATKTCPDGKVSESKDFVTTGCVLSPSGDGGQVPLYQRCAIMPDLCAKAPIVAACPTGMHWTLLGTSTAHCVQDDPTCPWGTSLIHDLIGNPSCAANTCSSNQVLQADGKACGCASGLVWDGASCVVPTPTCYTGVKTTASGACPYGGTKWYNETTSCPAGPFGAPSVSGVWDESQCAPRPVTCRESSSTEAAACPTGGTQYRQVFNSCPGGQYGAVSTNYGAWDTSSCVPACTPTSSTYATSCGGGYSGTKYVTTNYTCPSGSWVSENTAGCGCANGAADFPRCTPPPNVPVQPPPTAGCYDNFGLLHQVGGSETVPNCDVPGGRNPYPKLKSYKCTANGWVVAKAGGPTSVYCD